jgi:hypothetical protein
VRFFKFGFLLALTLSLPAFANRLKDRFSYYPDTFYENVEAGEHGATLRNELFDILSQGHTPQSGAGDHLTPHCKTSAPSCFEHTSLGYTAARTLLFGELHLERVGSGYGIRDAYCQHLSVAKDYPRNPPAPGQIPNPEVINAEHTWPQSKFSTRFDQMMQKSDLHILYPVLAEANTSRSNNEFNEVVTTITSPCPLSKRGYSESGNTVYFEPPEVHKGNVARAIFYFAVRYKMPVSPAQEASLKAWHHQDPPDDFERHRNEAIFAKQKVRNPFIDHPELVDLVPDF